MYPLDDYSPSGGDDTARRLRSLQISVIVVGVVCFVIATTALVLAALGTPMWSSQGQSGVLGRCKRATDCANGLTCATDGVCRLPVHLGGACSNDASGMVCARGTFALPSQPGQSCGVGCGNGLTCDLPTNKCVPLPPPQLGVLGGPCDDSSPHMDYLQCEVDKTTGLKGRWTLPMSTTDTPVACSVLLGGCAGGQTCTVQSQDTMSGYCATK